MDNEKNENRRGEERLASYIGLAKKAGAISAGVPLALDSVRAGKALMVLAASDISGNTKKKLKTACEYYGVTLRETPLDMSGISHAVGVSRACGAVAVTGGGFVGMIEKALGDCGY